MQTRVELTGFENSCELYKEERDVLEKETRKIDESHTEVWYIS